MKILRFFVLTFGVSWPLFVWATRLSGVPQSVVLLVATITPSLVGLALMRWEDGHSGVVRFFSERFTWATSARWFAFAIGYFAAIKLAAAVLHRVIAGAWPRLGDEPWFIIVAAIAISTPVQAGEEIGWRGYALPRMANRMGLGPSSLLLGVLWSVWHLPVFFLPGADKFGQSFPVYLIGTTTLSVAMAWLYANTRGSVLMTMLMHSAVNQTTGIVPSAVPGATEVFALSPSLVAWLTVGLMSAVAVWCLARMPRGRPTATW